MLLIFDSYLTGIKYTKCHKFALLSHYSQEKFEKFSRIIFKMPTSNCDRATSEEDATKDYFLPSTVRHLQ